MARSLSVGWGILLLWALAGASPPKKYGSITYQHLDVLLPEPAPPLARIDFRNFAYRLFPSQEAPDASRAGIPPATADPGAPLLAPVVDGTFNRRNDATDPFEFDVLKVERASLPHAPDKQAAIVFGLFYAGHGAPVCTGVVQVLARRDERIEVLGQFTFDCRGGMNATYIANKRRLHIESSVYAAGDPRCCPSLADKVNFKLEGDKAKASVLELSSGQE